MPHIFFMIVLNLQPIRSIKNIKWAKIGDRYRVDIEAVRYYGIPRNEPMTIEFDYGDNDHDKFSCDSEEEARDILKEVDIAVGLYSIQED